MSILEGPIGYANLTLLDIFAQTLESHPREVSLQSGRTRLSYRQLNRRALQIAKRLNNQGVTVGDRVSIQLRTGDADLYVSILGILFSGAAYVPIDAEDPERRVKEIQVAAAVSAHIGEDGIEFFEPRKAKRIKPGPQDDAWVIFTSGSTGVPKGVAVTHASAANLVRAEQDLFCRANPIGPKTKIAATLSPAFDASIEEMWLAWSAGATLVPIDRRTLTSGPDLASELRSKQIDVLSTVPSLAHFLCGEDLGPMRLLILGGEAVSKELAAGLLSPGREVWNTYGPTEATIICTAALLEPEQPITIGSPIAGASVAVVDAEGYPVPMGGEGELVIFGLGLARYLDDEADSQKFRKLKQFGWDRAYFTGDLVRPTESGLEFIGRVDEQVKVGGKRIDLAEIELAVAGINGVRASAAIASKTATGDHEISCFITVEEYSDQLDYTFELSKRLPAGVRPYVQVIDALPLKSSGKTDKSKLRELIQVTHEGSASAESMDFVSEAFARTLGLPAVSRTDNFFDLGGTSIKVARLVVELRQHFPTIKVADVYRFPTSQELEAEVGGRGADSLNDVGDQVYSRVGAHLRSLMSPVLQVFVGTTIGMLALILLRLPESKIDVFTLVAAVSAAVALMAGPVRATVSAVFIRLITVGISEGTYARNGLTHARIWLAERVADVFTVYELLGTPWLNLFARITGSRIGKNCSIDSMPPILGNLRIGDYTTIGRDVHLSGWRLEGSRLVVAGYEIGEHSRLANRTFISEGARIGQNVEIETGSLVEGEVSPNLSFHGSPLEENQKTNWPTTATNGNRAWAWAYSLTSPIIGVLNLLQYLPVVLIFATNPDLHRLYSSPVWIWALLPIGPLSLLINALVLGTLIRFANKQVRPGTHPINSREGYFSWLAEKLIQRSRRTSYWIYASVITPSWLRFLGAKVGSNCEISTFNGQMGLVEIGDECFLADDVSLAARESKSGWVRLGRVTLEKRVFLGNSARVRADVTVKRGVLAGVASEVPEEHRSNDSFLGLPAISFARAQSQGDVELRYRPSNALRAKRLFVELFRLTTASVTFMLFSLCIQVAGALPSDLQSTWLWTLTFGLTYAASGYLAVLTTVFAKWTLVWRIRQSTHNLWTNFVWRNELVWNFVESLAIPWVGSLTVDTPVQSTIFRMLGAKIGKNTSIATWFLDDPDLIEIGDNCNIMKSADVQTHLFQDRVMQLDWVRLGNSVDLGSGAFILPGVSAGNGSEIAAGSLVARNDHVLANSRLRGNPTESR